MPSKRLVHADVVSAPWALAEQAPRSAGSRRRARHSPRIDCGQGTESATRAPGSRPRRSNRPSGLRRSDQRLPRRLSEGRGLTKLRGRAAPAAGKARVSVVRRAGQPGNTRIDGQCGGPHGLPALLCFLRHERMFLRIDAAQAGLACTQAGAGQADLGWSRPLRRCCSGQAARSLADLHRHRAVAPGLRTATPWPDSTAPTALPRSRCRRLGFTAGSFRRRAGRPPG